jgi:hypothetical protein
MANKTKEKGDRYFEDLDRMEEELGGILVAGPNAKHKNEELLIAETSPKQKKA